MLSLISPHALSPFLHIRSSLSQVRKHCIIFSAFSLKAVIMCHKCLLLTPAIGQMNAASLASMGHDNSVLAILLQRLVKGTKPLREREKKLSMGQNAIVTPPLAEGEIPPPPPPLVVPGPSSPRLVLCIDSTLISLSKVLY